MALSNKIKMSTKSLFDKFLDKLAPFGVKNIKDLIEYILDKDNIIMVQKIITIIKALDVGSIIPDSAINLIINFELNFADIIESASKTINYALDDQTSSKLSVEEMKSRIKVMASLPLLLSEYPKCKEELSDDAVEDVYDECISLVIEYFHSKEVCNFMDQLRSLISSSMESYKKNESITDPNVKLISNMKTDFDFIHGLVDITPNLSETQIKTVKDIISIVENLFIKVSKVPEDRPADKNNLSPLFGLLNSFVSNASPPKSSTRTQDDPVAFISRILNSSQPNIIDTYRKNIDIIIQTTATEHNITLNSYTPETDLKTLKLMYDAYKATYEACCKHKIKEINKQRDSLLKKININQ